MARLPDPGGDKGTWGDILDAYLAVSHNDDGTIKPDAVSDAVADAIADEVDDAITAGMASKADDDAVVHDTGSETIAGVKTFSSSPIVPTPSSGTQAANKTYADTAASSAASGKADDSAVVHDTGNETIAGTKTFSSSPLVPDPLSDDQAANKEYVDSVANAAIAVTSATDDYTLVLGDAGKTVELDAATAKTVTIPANASVAFPVGTVIGVTQIGVGAVTVEADGGVTLEPDSATLAAQWSEVVLRKRATNSWIVSGDVLEDPDFTEDLSGPSISQAIVAGIRGANVNNGALTAGRGYVFDGTELVAVGLDYVLANSTSSVTVASTAVATSILGSTFDIPANTLKVGDALDITAFGEYSNSSGSNRTLTLQFTVGGSTILSTTSEAIASNASGRFWSHSFTAIVTAIGISGTMKGSSAQRIGAAITVGNDVVKTINQSGTTINTTTSLTCDVQAQHSFSASTVSITAYGVNIRKRSA